MGRKKKLEKKPSSAAKVKRITQLQKELDYIKQELNEASETR